MYRIVKDGAELALIEAPSQVKTRLGAAGRKRVLCAVPGGGGRRDCP